MADAMSAVATAESAREARQTRTVAWVMSLALVGLLFDGYDLVVYGACVSTFLRDATQLGVVTPAIAGQLGSYALFGVLVGALLAGSFGDILGRRKIMLFAYAWFSIGMAATALTSSVAAFGIMRFLTGLGVGALVATTAALVSEFAPKDKKNLCNAIVYSGIPAGSLLAAALAIVLMNTIGWRGLFLAGALPLVTLLPLAYFKMPESVIWLAARGRMAEASALATRTGISIPVISPAVANNPPGPVDDKASWAGLFTSYPFATILLGLMSATGLMLAYSLNTWLPELMLRAGFEAFLLELLSDFQVSIPELGTIRARLIPLVVLTSNGPRELSAALRRRCLYHYLDYPSFGKERAIVHVRLRDTHKTARKEAGGFPLQRGLHMP